ncbi:MAG: DUF362 domain-containing protein [Clostridia bacterium]|nr:DUF362 domain-containing protein [Clostridia bacterium]
MSRVSIVKCSNYEVGRVKEAIKKSIDHLGGMSAFVKPGEKVLLKVNLLMKRKPEKVTTTHPSLAQALAELVIEAGGKPIIGDSPGGHYFYNKKVLEGVYETCGMKEAAEKSGAELNYNTEMIDVPYPEGKITKTIKTIKPVLEADKIINIPKIKTHMMTVYSGAVKNLFGIIPGGNKMDYHLRFEDVRDFADLLIDICSFAKPTLTVMDAVIGMEGYGPTSGNPKKVGLIMASADPFALDVAATNIIGLQPEQVPTIKKSIERGLCTGDVKDIDILGETLERVAVKDFKKPTVKVALNFYNNALPKPIVKAINRMIKPKPRFKYDTCKSCAVCAKSCPPKAIEMKNGKPVLDLNKCIRCFCCHELCHFEAIDIKRAWYAKWILR